MFAVITFRTPEQDEASSGRSGERIGIRPDEGCFSLLLQHPRVG